MGGFRAGPIPMVGPSSGAWPAVSRTRNLSQRQQGRQRNSGRPRQRTTSNRNRGLSRFSAGSHRLVPKLPRIGTFYLKTSNAWNFLPEIFQTLELFPCKTSKVWNFSSRNFQGLEVFCQESPRIEKCTPAVRSRAPSRLPPSITQPRMRASTSSRLRSIRSRVRASRFNRTSGSVFEGRTLNHQSAYSTVRPSSSMIRPSR